MPDFPDPRSTASALSLPLALLLIVPGCNRVDAELGVSDEAECIERFVVPSGDESGARWAAGACRELFDPGTDAQRRRQAICALPKIAEAGSETGTREALESCDAA